MRTRTFCSKTSQRFILFLFSGYSLLVFLICMLEYVQQKRRSCVFILRGVILSLYVPMAHMWAWKFVRHALRCFLYSREHRFYFPSFKQIHLQFRWLALCHFLPICFKFRFMLLKKQCSVELLYWTTSTFHTLLLAITFVIKLDIASVKYISTISKNAHKLFLNILFVISLELCIVLT